MPMAQHKQPTAADLEDFGSFLAAFMAVLAAISIIKQGNAWPILIAVAGYGLVAGYLVQPAIRPVFRGAMWLGLKINWFMTRLILTVFFAVILTPIGLFMRLFRKDMLGRKADRNAPSYWTPHKRGEYQSEQTEKLW